MRCGFVAVVGRTNVGKSTLVNGLVGEKVAIVTPKPQTTRNVIRGILNEPRGQMVFLDTPGLHKAKTRMNQTMARLALDSMDGVDAVLWDDQRLRIVAPRGEEQLAERVKSVHAPLVLALNQVDKVRERACSFRSWPSWPSVFRARPSIPLCSLDPKDYPGLLDLLFPALARPGTDFPARALHGPARAAARRMEVVREHVFARTRQEIPTAWVSSSNPSTRRPRRAAR